MCNFNGQSTFFLQTFGCQQNVADSEKLRGILLSMGLSEVNSAENARVILFNTCAIRENARDKAEGHLGQLKKLKQAEPGRVIIIAGCLTQQRDVAEDLLRKFPFVDIVLGTNAIYDLRKALSEYQNSRNSGKKIMLQADNDGADFPEHEIFISKSKSASDDPVRANISIMYGCDNYCSYCVVPYVRGRERSRNPEDILEEARRDLLGYEDRSRELLLLGQNVNAFGKGTDCDFPKLLHLIDKLPGEFRISFMTSNPRDCGDELFKVIADSNKITRRLHLPVQSGSDRILTLMNRGYTRERYLNLIAMARELMPDISVTTDIIVGFPGETEEDFAETMSLADTAMFDSAYMFLYSPRPGTKAAGFPDDTPREVKAERFSRLQNLMRENGERALAKHVGQTEILILDGFSSGKNRQEIPVILREACKKDTGFIKAEITGYKRTALFAKEII